MVYNLKKPEGQTEEGKGMEVVTTEEAYAVVTYT